MISLPEQLLKEVDGIVSSEKCRSRSEFVRKAMRLYIEERRKNNIREYMKQGYEEMAEINLELANEALEAENEADQLTEELVSGV
ncbi:CopG family ribbon-helix-helix protein [Natranaerobius trueperi]|uniref:CopG family transcriptional regulator n=1 Tax=Natranaerobius trueperi TaxID=759412 RepID=A0A226BVB4_9FIRM|nr:CopG family transcriptional regulator [Natranaerobius trueperi]